MGKALALGANIKYPIVISKLLKKPGDQIKKRECILQYKFTWIKLVGDPIRGEEQEEEQTTIADWESPTEGRIITWKVREGQKITNNLEFVDVEEDCSHSIQFAGLCAICGKDMTETSWASTTTDTERAKINMTHDQTHLTVSEGEASKAEEELQRRLLKLKKLSLVVDLDQTIIHACIEPTVGEWQRDPTSPNYDAVKDVKSFQLANEANRGQISECWYYIKMRPRLSTFLTKISELYELHVYTMGTRAYALNIAKIIDPDKKLFGDRIISRDENGSITAKSLARLFPVDTKMVVIIDDRADVWPKNRPNLIKVHPYDFFVGIGDINSSFLPKREEIPKVDSATKRHAPKSKGDSIEKIDESSNAANTATKENETSTEDSTGNAGPKISPLEELVKMGGGDDQALREEQSAEQAKFLETQLKERPLAHLQEQLEKEASESDSEEGEDEKQNGDANKPHTHHKPHALTDNDTELIHLQQHLTQIHKAFYDQYEGALVNARGGRVAQLKPGHNKKISIKDEAADLKLVPDIAVVMPMIKNKVLEGTILVLSGLVPLSAEVLRYIDSKCFDIYERVETLNEEERDFIYRDLLESEKQANTEKRRTEIAIQAASFGAQIELMVSRKVTHLITPTLQTRTSKVRQAAKYPGIKIVTHQWLLDSISKWERQEETPYLVTIHESDRKSNGSPPPTDESDIYDSSADEFDVDSVPASQNEEEDIDGVMPDDIDESKSPIDGDMPWDDIDDELNEFLNGSDSDAESTSSRSSAGSNSSARGTKRNHGEITDTEDEGDESDSGSKTTKKQRFSSSRSTGLSKVKTPNSETSLPTPGHTDGDGDGDLEDDDDFGDLEAALAAEFENQGV